MSGKQKDLTRWRSVPAGPYEGYWVCTARKAGPCQWYVGNGRQCGAEIAVGDSYVRGDNNPFAAGGFARLRWCLKHFPNIAKATGQELSR